METNFHSLRMITAVFSSIFGQRNDNTPHCTSDHTDSQSIEFGTCSVDNSRSDVFEHRRGFNTDRRPQIS